MVSKYHYQPQSKTSVCYKEACIHTEGQMADFVALMAGLFILAGAAYVISKA